MRADEIGSVESLEFSEVGKFFVAGGDVDGIIQQLKPKTHFTIALFRLLHITE